MIVPESCWVSALNALQKSMMLTPCWPRAGPTGGAGFAAPAGICSLISVRTFFAIRPYLCLLDLVVADLDRGLPAEDRDEDLELGRVVVDLGDLAAEVRERAGDDLDRLAHLELGPGLGALLSGGTAGDGAAQE